MLSLKSTTPPSQNPNLDYPSYTANQLNHPLYFNIANYLMSDLEDCGSNENNISFQGKVVEGCSPHNMKPRRGVSKYKTQDERRFAFRTKTQIEIMDDGYKWRKYGKKMVKNNPYPRNYFKCSSGGCNVKKRVERDSSDASYVITTYQGMHNHASPTCILYCSPQPQSLL